MTYEFLLTRVLMQCSLYHRINNSVAYALQPLLHKRFLLERKKMLILSFVQLTEYSFNLNEFRF